MSDIVSKKKRSEIMSKIGGKNTKPEMMIRKALHGLGYRYRLHVKEIPGSPDLYFPKYNALIEVNGCFWHGHNCHMYSIPKSRTEFWINKIQNNIARDKSNREKVLSQGYRLLEIWECSIRGKTKIGFEDVLDEIEKWLKSENSYHQIEGKS